MEKTIEIELEDSLCGPVCIKGTPNQPKQAKRHAKDSHDGAKDIPRNPKALKKLQKETTEPSFYAPHRCAPFASRRNFTPRDSNGPPC